MWGVYYLVLKKPNHKSLLYIGSSTATQRGVRARFESYKRPISFLNLALPRNLEKALKNGYQIICKGLFLHCPIPPPANQPILRYVVVALEAAFTCIFWAMNSRDKDCGFGEVCLWSRNLFEWAGLCSHNPLLEPVPSDLHLSGEQLEAIAAATQENKRQNDIQYRRNLRANPTEKYLDGQRRNRQKHKPVQQAIHRERVEKRHFTVLPVISPVVTTLPFGYITKPPVI